MIRFCWFVKNCKQPDQFCFPRFRFDFDFFEWYPISFDKRGDTEEQDELVEETPPLKFSTPKQDELNKQINVENEILVVLYKKKELNQMTENDRKEIETWIENLDKLKKKLRNLKLNQQRSQK